MSSAGSDLRAPAKAKDGPAVLRPTVINQTPLAQATTHIIPAAQLGLFLLRFDTLVLDPVATMSSSMPIVAALQLAYALICLPPAGSQSSRPAKKAGRADRKKAAVESARPNIYVAATLSLVLAGLATGAIHIVLVLFGAPALDYVAHTLLCAAHLAILSFFPLFYVYGVDGTAWAALATGEACLDEPFGGLVGGVVGAWLGAIPIPLDWDREWQKWPVTILCGLYGGYALGKSIAGTVFYGKKLGGL